jgi:hypothetical protein
MNPILEKKAVSFREEVSMVEDFSMRSSGLLAGEFSLQVKEALQQLEEKGYQRTSYQITGSRGSWPALTKPGLTLIPPPLHMSLTLLEYLENKLTEDQTLEGTDRAANRTLKRHSRMHPLGSRTFNAEDFQKALQEEYPRRNDLTVEMLIGCSYYELDGCYRVILDRSENVLAQDLGVGVNLEALRGGAFREHVPCMTEEDVKDRLMVLNSIPLFKGG